MENMQDKEFDQLFKDRLAGASVEPPVMMWNKIEQDIKPVKRKTKLPVLWMAAASAVVVMAAGLLLKQEDKIQLRATAKVKTPTAAPAIESPVTSAVEVEPMMVPAHQNTSTSHQEQGAKKIILAMQPIAEKQHLSDIGPAVDMMEEPVPATPLVIETEAVDTKQVFALNSSPEEPATAVAISNVDQENRRGIRNIGDLVNFVVDKVDKRDEKILEFHTDDDDQSSLVAINIGILKLNTKNRTKR